jgi:hypothetical protein
VSVSAGDLEEIRNRDVDKLLDDAVRLMRRGMKEKSCESIEAAIKKVKAAKKRIGRSIFEEG